MLTDDQINAMHRRIWARQQAEQAAQLGDPEVMRLVQKACQIEASYIRLWSDEITARTRTAKTFEEIVQGVVRVKRDRAYRGSLADPPVEPAAVKAYRERQRSRAQRPRGRLRDADGWVTLQSLIVGLMRFHANADTSELWLRLRSKLDEMGLDPVEKTLPGGRPTLRYNYREGGTRTISYGHFANLVSKARSGF